MAGLGEALTDVLVQSGRVLTGTSHTLGVINQLKQRYRSGDIFNGFAKGVPFSTTGKIMVAGWAMKNAVSGVAEGRIESRLGEPSGDMVTATPKIGYSQFYPEGQGRVPSTIQEMSDSINEANYYNSSVDMGATGDLVFAMNRNRRG